MAQIHFLIITLSLLLTTTTTATATVTHQELEAALFTLRSRGYTLFPNAITTSDLRPFFLSLNSTFTLFSPPDPLLFSLDFSSTASHYVLSLLHHVSPLRLSMSQLRSIRPPLSSPSPPYLDTLVPPHRLSIVNSLLVANGTVLDSVLVDGVRVSVPDLFLGDSIAVHGLEGILVNALGEGEEEARADHSGGYSPALSPATSVRRISEASAPSPRLDTWRKEGFWNLGDFEGNIGKRKFDGGNLGDFAAGKVGQVEGGEGWSVPSRSPSPRWDTWRKDQRLGDLGDYEDSIGKRKLDAGDYESDIGHSKFRKFNPQFDR